MIDIFIQFGDDEAREIGLRLRTYLLDKGLYPFLAGRGSSDIPTGIPDYWKFIRRQIIDTDVMVSICNNGFEDSPGVQREFRIIKDERNNNYLPIIPFIKEGCSVPKYFEKTWHPLFFEIKSCEEKFCDLLNEIYS